MEDILEPLITLMKFGGIWMNYPDNMSGLFFKTFNTVRLLLIFLIWTLPVCKIISNGIAYILDQSSVFVLLGSCVIFNNSFVFYNYPEVMKTIISYKYLLSTHSKKWENDIIKSTAIQVYKFVNLQVKLLVLFGIFYVIIPVVFDSGRAFAGYENAYKVPLPLDGYLNDKNTRDTSFYLVLLGSHLWFALIVSNYVAFEGLVFYLCAYMVIELRILTKKLEILNQSDKTWDLHDVVKHHQMIIKIMLQKKKWLAPTLVVQHNNSIFAVCLVTLLMQRAVFINDQVLIVLCGSFWILLNFILFIFCASGQIIETESQNLFRAICEIDWHKQPPKTRKDLNMILMQSSRFLHIDYKGVIYINFQMFMQMLNSSYSFFMLINSTVDKNNFKQ